MLLVACAVAVQHAQQAAPVFRSGVEYVQVDARVIDDTGEPIRGLTQADFQITEDGAPQKISTFAFVDLPLPPQTPPPAFAASAGVRPDVATNVRASAPGRTFLIVFEASLVAPCQTLVIRKTLRRFIERSVGPADLVAIASTGRDRSFTDFTSDKARLLAVVDSLIGQAGLGPTVAAVEDIAFRADQALAKQAVGAPVPAAIGASNAGQDDAAIGDVTLDDPRQALRRLLQLVQAMSASGGEGSKAIILVSEGIPLETAVDPAAPLSAQGNALLTDMERLATAARRGNVPVYPLSPRGMTDGYDCEADGNTLPAYALLGEVRQQQDNLRVLADDTGGAAVVGVNDLNGGLERVVRLSSTYYVIGFNSSNKGGAGRYHRIKVTVDRPGARVVSRKGYVTPRAPDRKALAALAGPPGSSVELREALNAVLPMTDLPMSLTAAAFRQPNRKGVSAAVVIETLGHDLDWTPAGVLAAPVEMTAAALQPRGGIRTGEQAKLQITQPADTAERIRSLGVRWLARLDDLTPGRYEIRGAVTNGPLKQGSVSYELQIPDLSKRPLAMSDVVIASVVASQRLTLRPDRRLSEVLPAPPTTLRQFLPADTIAIYAEAYDNDAQLVREIETSVSIVSAGGEERGHVVATQMPVNGVVRIQQRFALAELPPGSYTLAVEARQTANRSVAAGRALPFQIVDAGNR